MIDQNACSPLSGSRLLAVLFAMFSVGAFSLLPHAAACGTAAVDEQPADQADRTAQAARGHSPPEKLSGPMPPPFTGLQGQLILDLAIDERGDVTRVEILQRVDEDYDSKAVQAVRQWKFKPATRAGKATASRFRVVLGTRPIDKSSVLERSIEAPPEPEGLPTTQLETAGAPSADTVSGRVLFLKTGLADIPVTISTDCSGADTIRETETDDHGNFLFSEIQPGTYHLLFNGSARAGSMVSPYQRSCSWELHKKPGKPLVLNWNLKKTDLRINFPPDGSQIDTASPVFQWEPYPGAKRYEVILNRIHPSRETLIDGIEVTTTHFELVEPLDSGTEYWLVIWAYLEGGAQVAFGETRFSI